MRVGVLPARGERVRREAGRQSSRTTLYRRAKNGTARVGSDRSRPAWPAEALPLHLEGFQLARLAESRDHVRQQLVAATRHDGGCHTPRWPVSGGQTSPPQKQTDAHHQHLPHPPRPDHRPLRGRAHPASPAARSARSPTAPTSTSTTSPSQGGLPSRARSRSGTRSTRPEVLRPARRRGRHRLQLVPGLRLLHGPRRRPRPGQGPRGPALARVGGVHPARARRPGVRRGDDGDPADRHRRDGRPPGRGARRTGRGRADPDGRAGEHALALQLRRRSAQPGLLRCLRAAARRTVAR